MTIVVFRQYRSGETIALFPLEPYDNYGRFCMSYMHVGQHGGADYDGTIAKTNPADPDKAAELQRELVAIGYDDLRVRKRRPRA